MFLLGITTGVAGILGLPFPNGLIPQAPFHTESLCVTKVVKKLDEKGNDKGEFTSEATHVVEQRVSNLAQGLLTLGTMSGPLLVVLHLVPHGVLAGLFFIMGVQALEANGITAKLIFLLRDKDLTPPDAPLNAIKRRWVIWGFVIIELVGFGATFAITQTIAAVGFPVIILALIPIRALLLPRLFSQEELSVLDAPTASDFIMEGIGGSWGGASTGSTTPNVNENEHDGPGNVLANAPDNVSEVAVTSRSVSPAASRSGPFIRHHRRDSVFASPGSPRKSQEDLAELGRIPTGQSTATRRRSVSSAAARRRNSQNT